jgi:hypothetical protein
MMAQALRDWIPVVLDEVKPWFSGKDIPAGERWSSEVGSRLEDTNFGILCLTRENLQAPWLLFEAGALSKAVEEGAVCPYLLDVDVSEVSGPLSQFQAKKADKTSTVEMIQDINRKLTPALDSVTLSQRCDALWPSLEKSLGMIPKDPDLERAPTRPEPEILEELVERMRAMDRRFGSFEVQMRRLQFPPPETTLRERPERRGRERRPERRPEPTLRERRERGDRERLVLGREAQSFVEVQIAMDTPNYQQGQVVDFRFDEETDFLAMLSNALGLDPDNFFQSWFLIAPETEEALDQREVQNLPEFFRGSPAILRVDDDIPF